MDILGFPLVFRFRIVGRNADRDDAKGLYVVGDSQRRGGYFVLDSEASSRISLGERLKMNLVTEGRWKLIVNGLLETLKITLFSILLGTLLGGVVCWARMSREMVWRETDRGRRQRQGMAR